MKQPPHGRMSFAERRKAARLKAYRPQSRELRVQASVSQRMQCDRRAWAQADLLLR